MNRHPFAVSHRQVTFTSGYSKVSLARHIVAHKIRQVMQVVDIACSIHARIGDIDQTDALHRETIFFIFELDLSITPTVANPQGHCFRLHRNCR